MKTTLVAVLVAVFTAGIAAAQMPVKTAVQPKAKEEVKVIKAEKKVEYKNTSMKVKGVIESVDIETGKITVKIDKGEMMTFAAKGAKITKGGTELTLADLAKETVKTVIVYYEGDKTNPTVKALQIYTPKPKHTVKKTKVQGENK